MKKLLTLAALGLSLYIAPYSFAQEGINAFGIQLPIKREVVKSEVKGDYQSSLSEGTYNVFGVQLPLVERTTTDTKNTYRDSDGDRDYIIVFGVQVPVGPKA